MTTLRIAGIVGLMVDPWTKHEQVNIRVFDGSLADAEGVLAVERATFDESPYRAQEVQSMLTDGLQRAWVAANARSIVGFVIAFPTYSLRGLSWEVDLLAVLPAWRGRRIATRLVQEAATFGANLAPQARAFVATDNQASMKAFARAGFQAEPETRKLLILQPLKQNLRLQSASDVTFRENKREQDKSMTRPPVPQGYWPIVDQLETGECFPQWVKDHWTLLRAEESGQPAGYADLVEVQTLLYRGAWIESLVAPSKMLCEALVCEVVNRARAAGLREIGAMVPQSNRRLQQVFLRSGFKSLGEYYWFTAEFAQSEGKRETEGKQRHV